MRNCFSLMFTAVLFGVFLAGCLESTEQYTLNPDGSGKVTVEATVTNMAAMLGLDDESGGKKDSKEEVKKFVREMMESSSGVDAWKDITCRTAGDDKIYFKGTAYFSDFNALDIDDISNHTFIRESAPDGGWTIRFKEAESDDNDDDGAQGLSEEDITARVDSLRADYAMGRAVMEPILGGIRQTYSFTLPGTVTDRAVFNRTAKGAYEVTIDGKKILAVLDSVTSTDGFWREQVLSTRRSEENQKAAAIKMLFGIDGVPRLKGSGGAPLFDYNAEVKAAKKKYAAMLKPFGLKPGDIE